jgi:hypothetical protein
MITIGDLYYTDGRELNNCLRFYEAMTNAGLWGELRWADPQGRNPWHLQIVDAERGITFDFWPHKLKGHRKFVSGPAVEGARACVDLVLDSRKADSLDNFSLLEDDQ